MIFKLVAFIIGLIVTIVHLLDASEPKNKRKIDNDSM